MTALDGILIASAAISVFALAMTVVNVALYRRRNRAGDTPGASAAESGRDQPAVSICIPARNEAANLEACVRSVLAGVRASTENASSVEVLVYDDESSDATPAILAALTREDSRVRAVPRVRLPSGWNGKQHACDRLGRAARGEWLVFTDADVRFGFDPPPAARGGGGAIDAALGGARRSGADLVSTFPRQIVGTLAEALAVPMMHFILFSYLPMGLMRRRRDVSLGAGCGQFLMVRRGAYLAAGGHATFKGSMHDGIRLPRALREAGFHTDLFDGSAWCRVRMYRGLRETWRGFAKNAYEGVGSVPLLVVFTAMHLLGHVLPYVAVIGLGLAWTGTALGADEWWAGPTAAESGAMVLGAAACAVACHLIQRGLLIGPFVQGSLALKTAAVVLHPLAVCMMTAIQWHSLYLHVTDQRAWKGR